MLNDSSKLNIAIGTDIIEIERFRKLDANSPFYDRVFSEKEIAYCLKYSDPAPHFAATYAGKEAVVKATNSNCKATMDTIEILHTEDEAPYAVIHKKCNHDILLSLSHSSSHAVAVALAVHQSYASNMNQAKELLEQTVKQLLPTGEVS
jgi:holo-[acyl-carrier protein] synthase